MTSKESKSIFFSVILKNKIFLIEISKRLYKMHEVNPEFFNDEWLLKHATIHSICSK